MAEQEYKAKMEQRDATESLRIEAQSLAKEYVELLRAWIRKRESTGREIISIASELENVKQGKYNVKVASCIGATVAGDGPAMAAIFPTGELAAPPVAAGIAGAVAGGATTAAEGITEHFISEGKLQGAQTVLDADAEQAEKIEAKKAELDSKAQDLSSRLNLSFEQVLGALLMTSISDDVFRPENQLAILKVLTSSAILANMLNQSFGVGSVLGKKMMTFAEVSLKATTEAVKTVLKGFAAVAVGVLLVLGISMLVKNSMELANGSPSGAAEALRKIARRLKRQSDDLEEVLRSIRNETVDYKTKMKQEFRGLLEQASARGYALEEEAQQIYNFMNASSCSEWQQAFPNTNSQTGTKFAYNIARVCHKIGSIIERYLDENDPQKQHLNITLIGHGRIKPAEMIPCQLYYMTPLLSTITLYSPWGCAIDASVVYGIATDTIQIGNVRYSAPVVPQAPLLWNNLPRNPTLTPNVIFSPVLNGEDAHQDLMNLCSLLQGSADGLVISYFSTDLPPFPEIPLWAFSNAVAICGHWLNVSCTLRIAACLSLEDPSAIVQYLVPAGYLPNLNQYCQVQMNRIPPAVMTNHFTEQDQEINLPLQTMSGLFL